MIVAAMTEMTRATVDLCSDMMSGLKSWTLARYRPSIVIRYGLTTLLSADLISTFMMERKSKLIPVYSPPARIRCRRHYGIGTVVTDWKKVSKSLQFAMM